MHETPALQGLGRIKLHSQVTIEQPYLCTKAHPHEAQNKLIHKNGMKTKKNVKAF